MFRSATRSALISLAVVALLLVYLFTWEDPRTVVYLLGLAIPFYTVMLSGIFYLRRPIPCAIWAIAWRLGFLAFFGVLGMVKGGDEGFVLFFWNFAADLPILPVLSFGENVLGRLLGGSELIRMLICIAWYGGGGYWLGCWLEASQQRSGNDNAPSFR